MLSIGILSKFTLPPPPRRAWRGFSLIEVMIALAVVIILTLIAAPSFIQLMEQYRLISTTENLYYNLQFARSEALKEAKTIYVSFQTGSSWCYGLNSGSACTCSTPSSCGLGSYSVPSSQLTTLSLNGFGVLSFEGSRGTANAAGTITLTTTGGTTSMGVDVGTLGNLTLCSNTLSGYPLC